VREVVVPDLLTVDVDPAVQIEEPSSMNDDASSSAVTTHGPIEVAKSLPLAGPMPTCISRACRSRADQSVRIV
jgi:hypothetical protein